MFKFNVLIPKKWESLVRKVASDNGESLAGYIRRLVKEDFQKNGILQRGARLGFYAQKDIRMGVVRRCEYVSAIYTLVIMCKP